MNASSPTTRRRPLLVAGAMTAVLALATTLAVLWPGYDAQQTPRDNVSVWALQSGEGKRYARVNTELGEIDTVQSVENPSGLAQSGDRLLVFTDGHQRFADVDPALPPDLSDGAADDLQHTPADTVSVHTEGDVITYLTGAGEVYAADLAGDGRPIELDPYADVDVPDGDERPSFFATALTIDPGGTVYVYAHDERRIVGMEARTGRVVSDEQANVDAGVAPQLTLSGDRWALFDSDSGGLWISGGAAPIPTGALPGALVQRTPSPTGEVFIADAQGLIRVAADGSGAERVTGTSVTGVPTAPARLGDTVYAAWLGEAGTGGTLWTSEAGATVLDYGAAELGDEITPVFVSNGARMILNEIESGWVWTLPRGELVRSSQKWNIDEREAQQLHEQESQRVLDPKPPVAEADAFGVRAGRDAVLPVLLNDHDPNEDVLNVVPASVSGLPEEFGRLSVASNDQQIVIEVAPGATGSATFTYQVTDGTAAGGLLSEPATVTVTVVPDDVNNAPVWCGVDGCLSAWPTPQLAPGGTARVEVLGGWVDPDGDPIYLADAVNQSETGSVLASPDGRLTYQHPDPNATEPMSALIDVTVADTRGARAAQLLTISVTPSPELTLTPVVATGTVGQPVTVGLREHLSGVTGVPRLTQAALLDETRATVSANELDLSVTVVADAAGSYPLQVTVQDDATEVTAIVRVSIGEADQSLVSTVPLIGFVRPGEDATIDVLPAVSNPAGLVLLVSDLLVEPETGASVHVAAIGQQHIRVSGSTDDGSPGTLGVARYTVSDGSGEPGRTAVGEITLVLLPAADSTPPIAVDDRVTVRAGAQIDIPVLDNDTAPAGAQIALDPASIVNEHSAGLAFATNRLVRYLAPAEAGSYTVSYTVFRLGFPTMTDTARIHVTVVGAAGNAPPEPKTLEGRVLSGSTVSIPLQSFGLDPDGDAVTLDRIVAQPLLGTAAVSADGEAIVYTSNAGARGQDRLTYQVRDEYGETGTAEARIGVLDARSDPSPVTYSDYVQVQVGDGSEVVVFPTDNDIDPAGGRLEVTEVSPNAVVGTEEYADLQARLAGFDAETGEVRVLAGGDLGTASFTYTVRNAAGDTSMGLIVIKTVREPVPDYPIIRDTALTTETRGQLASGVDVLSGKVSWSTGDASGLELTLWRDEPGFGVNGWKISGSVPERSTIIPFEVTGASFTGNVVTSYGFLRIPGKGENRLSLKSEFAQVEVNEKGSVQVDLAAAIAVPQGERLELLADGVRASGVRGQAVCTAVGETAIRYDAGSGAPWQDSCALPVKLASQTEYTFLTLRVRVIAEDPQPEVRQGAQTVSPGSTLTYDLQQMVTWEGQQDRGRLAFAVSYQGDQFDVRLTGSSLTVVAKDAARPGRQEPVAVTLTSHPNTAGATLALTVGPAPSTLPRGASVTQRCSQADGQTSCSIPVVGQAGEVNPLPGTELQLVSVTSPANCRGVSFAVQDARTVRATWSADAPGAGACTGSFVVADAQGRQSLGERVGQAVLDLQGLPADPSRLEWTAFTGSSVNLQAVSESSSYPAVSGYRISNGQTETTCPASGACVLTRLQNGEELQYRVWAVNEVGESRHTAQVRAWAYQAPKAPQLQGQPEPLETDGTGGLARVVLDIPDDSTARVRITGGRAEETFPVQGSRVEATVRVPNSPAARLTVVPETRFAVPPASVGAGSSLGAALTIEGVHGIGAPTIAGVDLVPDVAGRSITATADIAPNGGSTLEIGFAIDGGVCQPSGASNTHTFTDIERNIEKRIEACARHTDGGKDFGTTTAGAQTTLVIPQPTGDAVFTVPQAPAASPDGRTFSWSAPTTPLVVGDGYTLMYRQERTGVFAPTLAAFFPVASPPADPGAITAFACEDETAAVCSTGVSVSAAGAPYPPRVQFPEPSPEGVCPVNDLAELAAQTQVWSAPGFLVTPTRTGAEIRITVTFPWGLQAVSWACTAVDETPEEPGEPEPPGDAGERSP